MIVTLFDGGIDNEFYFTATMDYAPVVDLQT